MKAVKTLVQFCEKKEPDIYHYVGDENKPYGWARTACGREGELYSVNETERNSMRLCKHCSKLTK